MEKQTTLEEISVEELNWVAGGAGGQVLSSVGALSTGGSGGDTKVGTLATGGGNSDN